MYETEIYEKLSICHFYLGDIEKSKYYKKRIPKAILTGYCTATYNLLQCKKKNSRVQL